MFRCSVLDGAVVCVLSKPLALTFSTVPLILVPLPVDNDSATIPPPMSTQSVSQFRNPSADIHAPGS